MQQPSPASQPMQRPPTPGQPHQQQPRLPMGFRPQQAPPAGYYPPAQARPGFVPPNGPSVPGQPGMPAGVRPGFVPSPQQLQQRPPVRPVAQSPIQAPAARPIVGSPVQQQVQAPGSPMSPSLQHAEHHKKKRMYPEQITKAYSGDAISAGYPTQPQQPAQMYGSPAPMNQQPQFVSPMGTPTSPYNQQNQYQQAQPQAQPGYAQPAAPAYGSYDQDPINQMTSQFGGMTMGASPAVAPVVPLIGTRPHIADIGFTGPSIRLPPNISVTDSPFINCDPSYQTSTINAIPATESLLKKSRLPFALVLAPYRSLKEGDEPVPVVRDSVIARCRRCRTYINPFVTFVEGGQRWKCNMCFLLNDVPAAFDYDNQTQQPADRWKRPELNYGCVEFVAPTEYMVRPPQAPAFVFVIDVSYSAIQSGMLATAARTILDSLERLPNDENRTRVGIITVDSSLHFYNLSSKLSEPQMLVVSDLEDIYLPSPSDLLVNLTESIHIIKTLLEKLPDMFKDSVNVNNALGTGLQAAFKLLSPIGGKIVCLQSTLPNTGVGTLKPREDVKLLGTSKESSLLNAASPFYKSFAVDCSRSQIPSDMRANAINMLNTMPIQLLIPYLYANLYSLHNMPAEAGEFSENGIVFPPALNLTAENLEVHGCYLLENGQNIYLWVGRNVVPQLCADLFDVKSYEGLKGGKITLPILETPLNRKVNNLVGKIREMRRGNYYPTLYLVKEDGDPYLRLWFLSHLIEDRTDSIMSYQQFLQHLKDRVSDRSKFS
ncbi:Protein transport protein SEC24 [Choanephora cucurbitarum]|uniref:Protein transport protein SEC24 n=1 Tax=Choanephora cucurbitarum TaxID=101091 RepID=A0A1C7N989_9FUNG|nr:Protein transport protein SEC24 [Choanephora cucurbitarum]